MDDTATRAAAPPNGPPLDLAALSKRAQRTRPDALWQTIPLECFVCAAAVIAAAGLKLAGLMP
ncbi:hypothetical protein [Methylobacterium nigriterrae]|uniref:hypothetical protein n=1 Tax=Methylobacterium nigriterrae TaxID=3127512 RepID=UPI003013F8A5